MQGIIRAVWGQLGTKMKNSEVEAKLLDLKELLDEVGWTKKMLAKKIAVHDHNIDDEKEYQRIKKIFTRLPKKSDRVEYYIQFILNHRENKNRNFFKLPQPDLSKFNQDELEILKAVNEISEEFFNSK